MANDFGKVAVFMGGWSAERNVSLNSGHAVLTALLNRGVDAHGIDVDRNIFQKMAEGNYDRVFNILHGRGGEDGVIQGMLDIFQIPYTGSGVLGSALAMDKLRTKQLWKGLDFPTPDYQILNNEKDCQLALKKLGLPLMIKPVLEGSSIGMSKVNSANDINKAWIEAVHCGGVVIAEKFIEGREYTSAILGEKVLPMIRLETPRDFYDYKAKYDDNSTQYHCPCGLSDEHEEQLSDLMLSAFSSVDASGWGRVDFMLDKDDRPWLIEVNTVPGMTDHSLVPMAAKQAGMSFDELVIEILKRTIN